MLAYGLFMLLEQQKQDLALLVTSGEKTTLLLPLRSANESEDAKPNAVAAFLATFLATPIILKQKSIVGMHRFSLMLAAFALLLLQASCLRSAHCSFSS